MAVTSEELDPTMKCIKYLLLVFNVIIVLVGVLIISVGVTIRAIYHDFSYFLSGNFFSPAGLMIAIGCLIFFVALFGCVGAAKESTCMIMVFSLFLGIIFILEISAGIAGYCLQPQILETIDENMNKTMQNYEKDREMRMAVDFVQSVFECCGNNDIQDWVGILKKSDDDYIKLHNITVPHTCCEDPFYHDGQCIFEPNSCQIELAVLISDGAALLGGAAITVSIIQVIGIYFSITLGKAIRHAKTERERRRQEIREQLINSYKLINPEKNEHATMHISYGTDTHSVA